MKTKPKVFIAHSSIDKEFVKELALNLQHYQINVWFDSWSLRVGDSLRVKISEGILDSNYMVVVLSPHSIKSDWVREELNAGLVRQMEEQNVFVLPVLLDGKSDIIPLFLKDKVFADFRKNYTEGFRELLSSIKQSKRYIKSVNFISRRHSSGWEGLLGELPDEAFIALKNFLCKVDNFGVAFLHDDWGHYSAYEMELHYDDEAIDYTILELYGLVTDYVQSWTSYCKDNRYLSIAARLTRLGYMVGKHKGYEGIEVVNLQLLKER